MSSLSQTFTEEIGMMWGAVWGWAAHAEALMYLGELDAAMDSCMRAEDIGRRYGTLSALSYPLVAGAHVLVLRDERGEASSRLREARELLDSHPNLIAEGHYWFVASLLAEADGDSDAALDALAAMWRTATEGGQRFLLMFRPAAVHHLVRTRRIAEALLLAREAAGRGARGER